jgi:hypothetical protein
MTNGEAPAARQENTAEQEALLGDWSKCRTTNCLLSGERDFE